MKKLLLFAIVVIGFATSSFAQVNDEATSSVTIITPITITKNLNLEFGTIAVNNTAGTVEIKTNNTSSVTGGVTRPTVGGTINAAKFHVTGLPGATYTISLSPATITLKSGLNSMTAGTFTCSPAVGANGVLTGGAEDIYVGGVLTVGASQAAGNYTTDALGGIFVTVNYN